MVYSDSYINSFPRGTPGPGLRSKANSTESYLATCKTLALMQSLRSGCPGGAQLEPNTCGKRGGVRQGGRRFPDVHCGQRGSVFHSFHLPGCQPQPHSIDGHLLLLSPDTAEPALFYSLFIDHCRRAARVFVRREFPRETASDPLQPIRLRFR